MNRRGFSMVELIVVMLIVGILANIAFPTFHNTRLKADAARVIADFKTIEVAVLNQFSETGSHPGNSGWGAIPAAFVPFLPDGFTFSSPGADYRWRRYGLASGLPKNPGQTVLLGLEIRATDRDLMDQIKNIYAGQTTNATNKKIVFVID